MFPKLSFKFFNLTVVWMYNPQNLRISVRVEQLKFSNFLKCATRLEQDMQEKSTFSKSEF